MTCKEFHSRSIENREGFWAEQATLIEWTKPFDEVLDYANPPFARWFVGGETNLCYNAVDRHLAQRGDQPALIYISTEVNQERVCTYSELHTEVQRMAAVLQSLGAGKGDRVLIYMPMVPEAIFAMLATVRLGAIHSVVFGGFAAHSLATRIDDAQPKVMIIADAGMRGGKVIPYKNLVDESLRLSTAPPEKVVVVNRGLDPHFTFVEGRDLDYAALRAAHMDAQVPCTFVESSHPSYILYTSGTTGKPKGVQRDTGGHAVALAASMKHIYDGRPGEAFFATSDIGWVVGHSYITYGPLLNGMATVVYEGLPIRPDAGIWWKIVQDHKVTVMFSAPTAIRVLKKQDPAYLQKYDISSLRHLFLAGEPLDEPTAKWIAGALGKPVYDNFWQTETGWPVITAAPGVEKTPIKFGSPSFPAYGYDVRLLQAGSGEELGRSHAAIAEVAVVGVADEVKGQVPLAFAVVKDAAITTSPEFRNRLEKEVMACVDDLLGPIGRPRAVHFVSQLPKTRSGKVLRRSIRAIAEGHDPGDLTTLDDPLGMEQIQSVILASA